MRTNLIRFKGAWFQWLALVVCCQAILQPWFTWAWEPVRPEDQRWRIQSFSKDAQVAGKNVFHLDFQRGENGSTVEKVWLATSSGLLEYDGYTWRRHGVAEGLPSDFVRCVLVTRRGELWVGTDRGAGIYDGKSFRMLATETNLAGPSVRRMVEDADGTIWFCSDPWPSSARSGGLTSLRDGQWKTFTLKEGLPSEYVVNYFRDSSHRQWVVTKDGVATWGGSNWVTSIRPGVGRDSFSSGCFAEVPGQPLLFSAGVDVYLLQNNIWKTQTISSPNPFHQHGVCATRDGKTFSSVSAALDRKVISEWTHGAWLGVSAEFELSRGYNEDIREAPDGNIWVVGFETVVCWRRNAQWEVFRNLSPPKFATSSNQFWFGWDSSGVRPASAPVRLEGGVWHRFETGYDDLNWDGAGGIWGWSSNVVSRWIGTQVSRFTEVETGLRVIHAGRSAKPGAYWLLGLNGSGEQQAARFLDGRWTQFPLRDVQGAFLRAGMAALPDSLWVILRTAAEKNAVIVHITPSKTTLIDVPRTMLSEFHHGLHVGRDPSQLWLYGDNGLYRTRVGSGQWEAITNLPGRMVLGMVERDHEIWVGCSGATGGSVGLARFRDGQWTTFPIRKLDNISLGLDQTVLVGGRGWLTVVENRSDAVPLEIELPEDIRPDGVVKGAGSDYWVGNAETLMRFRSDEVPPKTKIQTGSSNLIEGARFSIGVEAIERFRPAGIREDYSFSWRMDGGEWTPFQQNWGREIQIGEPALGRHSIEVRGRDSGGDIDPTPAVFEFTVHPLPLQSRTWFQWSVAAVMLLLTSLAFVAIRARTELASYARTLEDKVAERTAELEADLVERRRAETALRESEERWQFALEGARDGLWDWNLNTSEVFHSNRWKSMLGYADHEIDHAPGEWEKRLHPEDKDRVLELIQAHLDGKAPYYESEHRMLCKDGSYKWILDRGKVMVRTPDGKPVRMIGTHSDITSRKESERLIREAQSRFQQLAENIREVFWLTNADKSQMLYVSPGYERIWGRTCESLYHSPGSWLESIHQEDRQRISNGLIHHQTEGSYDLEYRILRPDGSVRWIHDRAFPVRNANGTVFRIAGIAEDITERRQLEAQFRQAQKMEALGTLSGGIAHDFNNILGAIFGNVHLAKLDLDPTHPASVSLAEIQKAANRARDLVGQILAFSRQQPKARQVIALEPIIQEAAGLLRASLPAEIQLIKTLDSKAPTVLADATQIHQIVLNLCTNAWHAIGEAPGEIEIQLRGVEIRGGGSGAESELRPGTYACLSVIDNGHGMDSATLERIFEPFFTTKEPGRGTGLGLSVVHGIVQSHDGVIRVSSQLGRGTSFYLYFPAVGAEAERTKFAAPPTRKGSGETILYIDDEKALVDLGVRMLQRLGYRVDGFTQPEAALKAFGANPSFYQLVVTDLHMPGISGVEFIEAIRKIHPTIPVVLSSGQLTEAVVSRIKKLGVARLLHKPSTMDEFSSALHEILGKKQP